MTIITEVRTYLNGVLNSIGREPVEVPDDLSVDCPAEPLSWLKLPADEQGTHFEIKVGSGIVQKL